MMAALAMIFGLPGLTPRRALALVALGAGLVAWAPVWPVVLAGSLIAGSGFGLIAIQVNRDFLTGFGPRGPGMVGLVNAVSGLGLIAAPLIYVATGSLTVLLFAGIAALALAILPLAGRGAEDPAAPRGLPDLRQPRMAILILNFLSVCIEAALAGLGVSALIALGWAEGDAARAASGFFTAFLLGRLSLYWLSRAIAPQHLFLAGAVTTAMAAALAGAGLPGIGFVLTGATVGIAFPAYFVWAARVLGPDPRMSASILLSGLTGVGVGPLVFGAVLGQIGFAHLFTVTAGAALVLSAVIALSIGPLQRRAVAPAG
jgi:fucose permease